MQPTPLYTGQVRRWTAPGTWRPYAPAALAGLAVDDTISVVRDTLVSATGSSGGICMWVELEPTESLLEETADRIQTPYEGDGREIETLFSVPTAAAAAAQSGREHFAKGSDRGDVLSALSELCRRQPAARLVVPVGEAYVDPETRRIAILDGANPFRRGLKASTNVHLMARNDTTYYSYTSDREAMLLEDAVGKVLNFATFEDVQAAFPNNPSHVAKFFPRIGSAGRSWRHETAIVANEGRGEKRARTETKMRSAILNMSILDISDISVSELFSTCVLSQEVPLVLLHNRSTGGTHFRAFRDAAADPEVRKHIVAWVAENMRSLNRRTVSSSIEPFLKAFVRVHKETNWVRVSGSGHVSVAGAGEALPRVDAITIAMGALGLDHTRIVSIAEDVMETFDDGTHTDAANALATRPSGIHAIQSKFDVDVDLRESIGIEELQQAILRSPLMLRNFVMTSANGSDGILLRYNRATGAARASRMLLVIKTMWSRPRPEVVSALQRIFALSQSVAEALVQRHTDEKQWSVRVPFWVDVVPIVLIDKNVRRVSILNVSRRRYAARIASVLGHLFSNVRKLALTKAPTNRAMAEAEAAGDAGDKEGLLSEGSLDIDQFLFDDAPSVAPRSSEVNESPPEEAEGAEWDTPKGDTDMIARGRLPEMFMLSQLHRADVALFKFPGTRYATSCGHNNKRQPVVVTREELKRIDKQEPGSHHGAIVDYGTTPEKAAKNAFICPQYWCERDRLALAKNKKCPNGDAPITFDSKYFGGKKRFVGLLDQKKHQQGFCMPCCFIKPIKRDTLGKCAPARLTGKDEEDRNESSDARELRYIMSDTSIVDIGRFAVLPPSIQEIVGNNRRCGNRDDGSGNINLFSSCYAQKGVTMRSSTQHFLDCMAYALDNPKIADAKGIVEAIADNISLADFVRLSGGRLARNYLSKIEPRDGEVSEGGGCRRCLQGFRHLQLEEPRTKLLLAARSAYIRELRDVSIVKTPDKHGLLELLSAPLAWLNPHGCNFMMLHVESASSIQCPSPLSSAPANWRLDAPTVLVLKRAEFFHPVVHLSQSRAGLHETRRLYSEMHPHVAALTRAYLGSCDLVGADAVMRSRELLETAVTVLAESGRKIVAQVIDYMFRPKGMLVDNGMYLPLQNQISLLNGNVGYAMDLMYLSDVSIAAKSLDPSEAYRLLASIAEHPDHTAVLPVSGISRNRLTSEDAIGKGGDVVAWRLVNGDIVPAKGFHEGIRSAGLANRQWFQDLNEFIEINEGARVDTGEVDAASTMGYALARHVQRSPSLSRDVAMLRNSKHPFSIEQKRVYAHSLLAGFLAPFSGRHRSRLVDNLLFGLDASARERARPQKSDDSRSRQKHLVVQFSDIDVATRSIESILSTEGEEESSKATRPSPLREVPWLMATSREKTKSLLGKSIDNVSVYAVLHMAHRMMYSDAPLSMRTVLAAMQSALLNRPDLDIAGNTTLGRLTSPQQRARAIESRSFERPDYVSSLGEIQVLSELLGVPVRVELSSSSSPSASASFGDARARGFLLLRRNADTGVTQVVWSQKNRLIHSS